MVDIERLKTEMTDSGMTMTAIASKSGILKATLYNRLKGVGDFTADEIVSLSETLHFTPEKMTEIFLTKSVK